VKGRCLLKFGDANLGKNRVFWIDGENVDFEGESVLKNADFIKVDDFEDLVSGISVFSC
jgi:hypothetical protein